MRNAGGVGTFIAGQIDYKCRDLFGLANPANRLAGDKGAASSLVVAGRAQALVKAGAFDGAGTNCIAADALRGAPIWV